MAREWFQRCKDCGKKFGYSDQVAKMLLQRGHSLPERCSDHRSIHSNEIRDLASSHFSLVPSKQPPSILGHLFLGYVDHGERKLIERTKTADSSKMDIGLTKEHVKKVFDLLESNQVVVIVAPTGSGKSTYIPYCLSHPPFEDVPIDMFTKYGPIIVTQPRIPATSGIPEAIADHLMGSSVGPGFDIGFRHGDSTGRRRGDQYDRWNRLIFVTDGTLINWLADGRIGEFSIVMIDEAHERSCNIDLILSLLKRELPKFRHLRVIVLSATIDAESFVNFFQETANTESIDFQETQKIYEYTVHWWEGEAADVEAAVANKRMPSTLVTKVEEILDASDEGGILAFLSGAGEIRSAIAQLEMKLRNKAPVELTPWHAKISSKERKRATADLPKIKYKGKYVKPRRIYLSTNYGETSLTLPDIAYVIDSGLIKQSVWNPTSCRKGLQARWHSQDGCRQRWGRAGRTRMGDVYTLYSEQQFANFPLHTTPEISRECLDDIILTAKVAGIDNIEPESFSWIENPPEIELKRASFAICHRSILDQDNDLTEEGQEVYYLARRLSTTLDKYDYNSTQRALDVATFLVLADAHGCLLEAVTVVAMMSHMGDALYWKRNGLFLWNQLWDIESKDHVQRRQLSLKSGCIDDLDYSCKLFFLYENSQTASSGNRWSQFYFVNEEGFQRVNQARLAILGSFLQGTNYMESGRVPRAKQEALRGIDFSLIPRLRLLASIAWPDRLVTLEGNGLFRSDVPIKLVGTVSKHVSGDWSQEERAIAGILDSGRSFIDGAMENQPVANFLIRAREPAHSSVSSILISECRAEQESFNFQEHYSNLMVDQAAKVGSLVSILSEGSNHSISGINEEPSDLAPHVIDSFDGQEDEQDNSYELYEHLEQDVTIPETGNKKLDAKEKLRLDTVKLDTYRTIMMNRASKSGRILEWRLQDGIAEAVVDGISDQPEVRYQLRDQWRIGEEINVSIKEPIWDLNRGQLAGLIAIGPNGIRIPIEAKLLTISPQSRGLIELIGQRLSLSIIGIDPLHFFPNCTKLPAVEADYKRLVLEEEIVGRIINIESRHGFDACDVSIFRNDGIVHGLTLNYASLPKWISNNISIGEDIFLRYRVDDAREDWSTTLPRNADLVEEERALLQNIGIELRADELICSKPLKFVDILPIRNASLRLYQIVRRLYQYSNGVNVMVVDTQKSREVARELLLEADSIVKNARTGTPSSTRDNIKLVRQKINSSTQLSGRAKSDLHEKISEAVTLLKEIQKEEKRKKAKLIHAEWRRKVANIDEESRTKTHDKGQIDEMRNKIKNFREDLKNSRELHNAVKFELRKVMDNSWKILNSRQTIVHFQNLNRELESRIGRSNSSRNIDRLRGYIIENEMKIEKALAEIRRL